MRDFSFITVDGPDIGRTFSLEIGTTIIGRRDTPGEHDPPGSHRWVLTDPAVSRTHARLDWDGVNPPLIRHLSSTNSTLLEGRILDESSAPKGLPLLRSQKIRMGKTCLKVASNVPENETKWYFLEQGTGESHYDFSTTKAIMIDELQFECRDSSIFVKPQDSSSEAYLLREIQEQFWTTSLKTDKEIKLMEHDVVRTEKKKLVLCIHKA